MMINMADIVMTNDRYSGLICMFFMEIVGILLANRKAIIAMYKSINTVCGRISININSDNLKSSIMGIRASKAPHGAGTPVKK